MSFQSNKECSHVWAATRELGTEMYFEGCDFGNDTFVDHTCNLMEDIDEWNCKQFESEAGMIIRLCKSSIF